jgi:hypothetical protein
VYYIYFSTWKEFKSSCGRGNIGGGFWQWLTQRYSWQEWETKNPSQRAEVVLEFWKEKGGLCDKAQA